ncbi:TonB-dependent receptor [uncultured Erythrobacter sp.]|uniref:TonB-dependent receptor n=1 Tax=uncultured Erythrobacter sp. TaxID=263913 RepID=UPI00261EA75E|nr:TonB-dependent receptor [uncultured Erythrobacter sp.]
MFNRIVFLSTAAFGAFMFSGQALAQSADQEAAEESRRDNTIIVTAQRREQDLQDVPASIGILSSSSLENALSGVEDVLGLNGRVPGLAIESSNGRQSPRFYIRGLGNTDFDTAASQPVSVVLDDVVLENVILKGFPIFDVEQVEVLRGPQGTLFGRNTPAGIVKFDTRKPSDVLEGSFNLNYGRFNTVNAEAAIGGPLIEDVLNFRVSGLYQRQDDWVDNAFTGEENFSGGFFDAAARLQLELNQPGFNALAMVSYADSNASATFFRANILSPGSNSLNSNFDRDVVAYDGGGGNPADRDIFLSSLRLSVDVSDNITLTSITSYSDLNRSGRGDIDGGAIDFAGTFGGVAPPPFTGGTSAFTGGTFSFPGDIPFPSDTGGRSDSDQFTQEIRLASDTSGVFNWQVGAFYFENGLLDSTFLGGAPTPATTWQSDQQSWAVFGQVGFDVSDALTLSGGLRYTDDERTFEVLVLPNPTFTLDNGTLETSIDDGQVSWDVSATYETSENVNLYGRIARGFRGPSIQGRSIAFGVPTSQAQSETVISYETGFKLISSDDTLRLNGSVFYYDVNDIQLTAVGGAGNFISLINAENADGLGFELDFDWNPSDYFFLRAGVAYVDTEIKDDDLAVAVCFACTVTDNLNAAGLALIDGNPLPQAPEINFNVEAQLTFPVGSNEIYFNADWFVQGSTNIFLYESLEFNHSGNHELGVRVGYIFADGQYEVGAFARNVTDEENLVGAIDFNNNTGFVNQPRIYGVSFRGNF